MHPVQKWSLAILRETLQTLTPVLEKISGPREGFFVKEASFQKGPLSRKARHSGGVRDLEDLTESEELLNHKEMPRDVRGSAKVLKHRTLPDPETQKNLER